MEDSSKRLDNLLRHVAGVRDDCELLGRRLMAAGEEDLGLRLIANGQVHDASKFSGIEWEYLNDGAWPRPDPDPRREMFLLAHRQHVLTNPHHPEYWRGIEHVPPVYLAEMVADWHSRSSEQGTDLMGWVKDQATNRFKFPVGGRVYKDLKRFIGLLLERKFA